MNDHRYMEYVIQCYMINDHRMNDHIYYMELSNYPVIQLSNDHRFIWSWGNCVS